MYPAPRSGYRNGDNDQPPADAAKDGKNGTDAYLPGTLDDTPVTQRRIVSLAEVQVLRERLDHASQLFVVCSAADGVEVLSLARLERRCEDGWSGILLAEAGDLPDAILRSNSL